MARTGPLAPAPQWVYTPEYGVKSLDARLNGRPERPTARFGGPGF